MRAIESAINSRGQRRVDRFNPPGWGGMPPRPKHWRYGAIYMRVCGLIYAERRLTERVRECKDWSTVHLHAINALHARMIFEAQASFRFGFETYYISKSKTLVQYRYESRRACALSAGVVYGKQADWTIIIVRCLEGYIQSCLFAWRHPYIKYLTLSQHSACILLADRAYCRKYSWPRRHASYITTVWTVRR